MQLVFLHPKHLKKDYPVIRRLVAIDPKELSKIQEVNIVEELDDDTFLPGKVIPEKKSKDGGK